MADTRPPYAVRATSTLTETQIRMAEEEVRRRLKIVWDCPTRRFVGRRLPDLFAEKHSVWFSAKTNLTRRRFHPRANRSAVFIRGDSFFERRHHVSDWIVQRVQEEPHILWQFVLCFEQEEPLDVLETIAEALRALPDHVLDRFIQLHSPGLRAARRLFVLLASDRRYSHDWQEASESFLRRYFY